MTGHFDRLQLGQSHTEILLNKEVFFLGLFSTCRLFNMIMTVSVVSLFPPDKMYD